MKKKASLDTTSSAERVVLDFRRAGFEDIMVIGKYNYNKTHRELPDHAHQRMLEICFCSKGEQVYEVGGRLYRIRGGELFVTYPGEWHGTGKHPEEKGELYWIIIKLNTQSRAKQFLRFDGRMAQEWFRQLLQLPRHFKGSRLVRQKLEKIFPLFPGHKDPLTRIHLQHQVADCLLEIIDCSKKQLPQRNSERLPLIDDFIRTHLDEPVTLPALAKLTRLSLSHFKSWFKQETGNTPLDYVLRYKIREAQRLLGNEKLSMADIAFDTGFQNPQYFASVFKKFTGLTPTAYRLRLRNGKRT